MAPKTEPTTALVDDLVRSATQAHTELDAALRRPLVPSNVLAGLGVVCTVGFVGSIIGLLSQHSNQQGYRYGFLAGVILAAAGGLFDGVASFQRQSRLRQSLMVSGVVSGFVRRLHEFVDEVVWTGVPSTNEGFGRQLKSIESPNLNEEPVQTSVAETPRTHIEISDLDICEDVWRLLAVVKEEPDGRRREPKIEELMALKSLPLSALDGLAWLIDEEAFEYYEHMLDAGAPEEAAILGAQIEKLREVRRRLQRAIPDRSVA